MAYTDWELTVRVLVPNYCRRDGRVHRDGTKIIAKHAAWLAKDLHFTSHESGSTIEPIRLIAGGGSGLS